MARYCADCKFLKIDDKGNGVYKCSKIDKEVLANTPCCEQFEFSYKDRTERDKYYDLGKEAGSKYKGGPIGSSIVIAIILFIALIICMIFMR